MFYSTKLKKMSDEELRKEEKKYTFSKGLLRTAPYIGLGIAAAIFTATTYFSNNEKKPEELCELIKTRNTITQKVEDVNYFKHEKIFQDTSAFQYSTKDSLNAILSNYDLNISKTEEEIKALNAKADSLNNLPVVVNYLESKNSANNSAAFGFGVTLSLLAFSIFNMAHEDWRRATLTSEIFSRYL